LISFEGKVLAKSFRCFTYDHGFDSNQAEFRFTEFGIGLGRTDKILCIRIGDFSSVDTIDLYFDFSNHVYALGIIPDTDIRVNRVLCIKKRELFCRIDSIDHPCYMASFITDGIQSAPRKSRIFN